MSITDHGEFKATDFPPAIRALTHVLELVILFSMRPERAILEAVMTRDDAWLKELLERFPCNLSDGMLCSARNGYLVAAELLLSNILDMTTTSNSEENEDGSGDDASRSRRAAWEILNAAVKVATENDHLNIVRLLLPRFDYYESDEVAWSVVDDAAAGGKLRILKFAVEIADSAYAEEPRENPSGPLLASISGGHADVAIFLIHRYYLKWNLTEAFERALVNDLTCIAECICNVYRGVGPTVLETLFQSLACSGYIRAIQYLYQGGCNSPELVQDAFTSAAQFDHVNVLTFLLDTKEISRNGYLDAFEAAARAGSSGAVSFLYQNELSAEAITRAFETSGSADTSKFLYDKLQKPTEATIGAFSKTVAADLRPLDDGYLTTQMNNRIELLKFLCSTGHVPIELIVHAFQNSTYPDVLQGIYQEECITHDIARQAFNKALKSEDSHYLSLMYTIGLMKMPVSQNAEKKNSFGC